MGDNQEFKDLDARALIGTVDWDSGGPFPNRKAIRLDPVTHSVLTVTYPHHEIHAGEHHVTVASTLADTGGDIGILFKSPAIVSGYGATGHPLDDPIRRKAHIEITISSAVASKVTIYRKSTKTFNAGATLNYWNRNLHAFAASEKYYTSAMSICVTAGGTETSSDFLGPIFLGAAGGVGNTQVIVGGEAGGRNEFILEPDEWYFLDMVSRADDNSLTAWFDG